MSAQDSEQREDGKEKEPAQTSTYFEKQRDALIAEIALSMDSVLNNMNALNRSLEGAIAVGKEFDSVSSLWSNFYDGLAQVEQLRDPQTGEESGEQDIEYPSHAASEPIANQGDTDARVEGQE